MSQYTLEDFESSGVECPSCDSRTFETTRAFNSHWGQVHDGSPPDSIDTSYGTHSEEHRQNLSSSLQGREVTDETRRKLSEANSGKTHSPEFIERRIAPQREKVSVECATCGDELSRTPKRVEKFERQFCDRECKGQWRSENIVGAKHPRWSGGPGGINALRKHLSDRWWREIAEEVRREYGRECQLCGCDAEDGRALDVHHIIPLISGGTNHKDNLIPLCHECHRSSEAYTRQFTEKHLIKYATNEEQP